jgi:dTDP-4-amino-4,6-dideoxygalactose transaminase
MSIERFAFFGAAPLFEKPLPVGQLYFPDWQVYELTFKDIFERQYYTNHGKLVQELEHKIQSFLGVKNAICVSNATIGLIMAAEAMKLYGKVIVPAFTFVASAQSIAWAGLEPVFCDVDFETHQVDKKYIDRFIDQDVSAILGVNLWGGSCDPGSLSEYADANGLKLYFDSAHAFGCAVNDTKIGNFGQAEVFSFHATKILNAAEGGCICTNDDDLADRLRNIRSSYGVRKSVNIVKTSNGRMSEAQAAIALISLENFYKYQKYNETLFNLYEKNISSIPGLYLKKPANVSYSNYQSVVCMVNEMEFGLKRDLLIDLLKAENIIARRYFYPGIHRTLPFSKKFGNCNYQLPNTDTICSTCIQLPIGSFVSTEAVEGICKIIGDAHNHSSEIFSKWK